MTIGWVRCESKRTAEGEEMKRVHCRPALAPLPGLGLPLCVFEPSTGFELVSSL